MTATKRHAAPVRRRGTYSTGELASLLKIGQQTVIRACNSGLLVAHRLPGSGYRRIREADAAAFARHIGALDPDWELPAASA